MTAAPSLNILIVDDSLEDRTFCARRMAGGGQKYTFLETDSGEEGLRLCRQQPVDCILLDYSLPDLNGLEFMSRLQAEQSPVQVAVVMLTGHGNEEVAVQALKQGAQDYLVKGRITGEDMRRAVHAAIDKIVLHNRIEEQRRELERRAAALRESEQRYRLLLREVHHRVKNNLQVIISMLNLQTGYVQDPQASNMFRESQQRVRCMAAIHEALYCSEDLARIDFAAYIRNLAGELVRLHEGHSRSLRLPGVGETVFLDMDTAIPCGLILHELVSNCFKHAYPASAGGEIHIAASAAAGRITLSVRDHGIGLPDSFDLNTARTLGLRLVRALTNQIGGTIRFLRAEPGTQIHLTFNERRAT